MSATFSADPWSDLRELVRFPFMVHALQAGTIVAVLAAVVGWYMILRREAFAGHSLSVMAFPGASGAALIGVSTSLGFYVACALAATAIGAAGRSPSDRRLQTATIGTVQAAGLGCGFLFLSLNSTLLGGPETLLFGSFLGITSGQVVAELVIAVVCLSALVALGRPLLFATVDREGASAGGVPMRALDLSFMIILGLAVAATSQITGALLVFALLVAPAATAQLATPRPLPGLLLSATLGVAIVWAALALAYFTPYPVGFYATSLGFGLYLLARTLTAARGRRLR